MFIKNIYLRDELTKKYYLEIRLLSFIKNLL